MGINLKSFEVRQQRQTFPSTARILNDRPTHHSFFTPRTALHPVPLIASGEHHSVPGKKKMENHPSSTSADPKDPASFLSSIIGVPVTVKLNSGIVYKGELQSVDGYMNIALEKCTEYVNGQLRRNYGDAFVRGNNVLYISSE